MSNKVHEAVSGETGLGKTLTDSTTSKKEEKQEKEESSGWLSEC